MIPTETDVLIVGCGPVGALMGNLLGQRGLGVAIFEREDVPHGIPRAFSCDDEALRIYQNAGLGDAVIPGMFPCPEADFVGADGRPFATVGFGEIDFGSGYSGLNFFHQPALEAALRAGLDRFPGVALHLGREVEAIRQEPRGVTVTVRDRRTGAATDVRARYVLACDGRRSTARKLAGIEMVGGRSVEPWIAIAGTVADPPATMPAARFVCDPRRPGFVARGAGEQCRWEFMLRDGETIEEMERPEAIARLVRPYVDPAALTLARASVYTFENKMASRWRDRRLFLLGDAAHTMPPMMGQGLVSGLRDAANLAWKLALVLRGVAGEALLDSYEEERRPHTQEMSAISARIGHLFLVRNERLAAARDGLFRVLDRVPRVRRFLRGAEFKPLPVHAAGLMVGGKRKGSEPQGTLFPQPWVRTARGERVRLDEALGSGFAVLGMNLAPQAMLASVRGPLWGELETRFLRVLAPHDPRASAPGEDDLVDLEGRLGAWFARHRAAVAVVRPDRFVYGASNGAGIDGIEEQLCAAFAR